MLHEHMLAQTAPVAGAIGLQGTVNSDLEGVMEGVLVSAKATGSTITTTVVSSASGRFSLSRRSASSGRPEFSIPAFGYNLDGPKAVDVSASGNATAVGWSELKIWPRK